jgi:hypothetical protein
MVKQPPTTAVRHALAEALGVADVDTSLETVDVAGAAKLLHTTVRGIYQRRHAGQMPVPVTRRPLVWRKADLLRSGK